jgi:hypothetical protein
MFQTKQLAKIKNRYINSQTTIKNAVKWFILTHFFKQVFVDV